MSLAVVIELGHKSVLKLERSADGMTHDWEVYVRGKDNAPIERFIDRVVFTLHKDFPDPVRTVKKPPFSIRESGYGCFQFPIDIYYKNPDRKKDRFDYDLVLKANCDYGHLKPQTLVFDRPTGDWKKRLIEGGAVPLAGPSSKPAREEKRLDKNAFADMKPPLQSSQSSTSPKGKVKPAKESKDAQKVKLSNSFADIFGEPAIPSEKKKKKEKEDSKKTEKPSSSSKTEKEKSEKPRDKSKEKKSESKHKDDEKKKAPDKDDGGKHSKKESKSEHGDTKKEDTRSVGDKLKDLVKGDGGKSKSKESDKAREKSDKKEKLKDKHEKEKDKSEKTKEKVDERSRKPEKEKRSESRNKDNKTDSKKEDVKPKNDVKKEASSEEKDRKSAKKDSDAKKADKSEEKPGVTKHSKEPKPEKSKEVSRMEKVKVEQNVKSEKPKSEKPREKVETPKEKVKVEEVKTVTRDPVAKKTMPVAKEQPKPEKDTESVARTEGEKSPVKRLEENVKDNRAKSRKDSSTSVSSTSVSSPSHMSSSSDSSRSPTPEPPRLPAKTPLPLEKLISNISSDSLSSSDTDFGSPNLKSSKEKKEEPKRKPEEKASQPRFDDEEKPPRGKGPPKLSSQPSQRSSSPSPEKEAISKKQEPVPAPKEVIKKQASQNKFPVSFIKSAMKNKERENEMLQKEKETAKMVGKISRTSIPTDRQKPKVEVESATSSSSSDSEPEKLRPSSRQNLSEQAKKPPRASPVVPEARTTSPLVKKKLNSSDELPVPKGKVPARASPVVKKTEEDSSSSSSDYEEEPVRKPAGSGDKAGSLGKAPAESLKLENFVKKRRSPSTSGSENEAKVDQPPKARTASPMIIRSSAEPAKGGSNSNLNAVRIKEEMSLDVKKKVVKDRKLPGQKMKKVEESSTDSSSDDEASVEPVRHLGPPKLANVNKGPSPLPLEESKQRPALKDYLKNRQKIKEEVLCVSDSSSEDDLVMPVLKQQSKKIEENERQKSSQREIRPPTQEMAKLKPQPHKEEIESPLSDSSSEDEKSVIKPTRPILEQQKKVEKVSEVETRKSKAEPLPLPKRPSPPEESSDEEGEIIEVDEERQPPKVNPVRAEASVPVLSDASSDEAELPVSTRLKQRSPRLRKPGPKSATRRSSPSSSSSESDKELPRQKVNTVKKTTGQKRDRESSSERSDHRVKKQPAASSNVAAAQKRRSPVPNALPPAPKEEAVSIDSESEDDIKPEGIQWVTAGPGEVVDTSRFTSDYLSDLLELQRRICSLSDPDLAQKVVDIIEQTGCFEISDRTFDFDACKLDVITVRKLRNVLNF